MLLVEYDNQNLPRWKECGAKIIILTMSLKKYTILFSVSIFLDCFHFMEIVITSQTIRLYM